MMSCRLAASVVIDSDLDSEGLVHLFSLGGSITDVLEVKYEPFLSSFAPHSLTD
jgi:hypothetical protein